MADEPPLTRDRDLDSWEPTRWWNVTDPDGKLWCRTSSEAEARGAMRPGDTLWREWYRQEREWRQEPTDD